MKLEHDLKMEKDIGQIVKKMGSDEERLQMLEGRNQQLAKKIQRLVERRDDLKQQIDETREKWLRVEIKIQEQLEETWFLEVLLVLLNKKMGRGIFTFFRNLMNSKKKK